MRYEYMVLRYSALALSLGLGGCMGSGGSEENFGVSSVNQPVVSGNMASVPNCPNWGSQGRDSAATTDTNYGCATNSNLAAMIDNPADLLHGRTDPTTGTDALIAVKAVKGLREKEATGKGALVQVSSKGGN